jgi:hypothetical protein
MPIRPRRVAHLLAGALAASSILTAGALGGTPTARAAATTVDAGGREGHIGVDNGTGAYSSVLRWDQGGNLRPGCDSPPCTYGGSRYEFYPHSSFNTYDPWAMDVGGVHINSGGVGAANLGRITLPSAGVSFGGHTATRLDGDILSATAVPDGRIEVHAFQVETAFPDPERPLPSNGTVKFGAFAAAKNKGKRWTAGVGWPGRYVLFVFDHATGRQVQAYQDLGYGPVPAIDLDAICFGFDVCQYNAGGPSTTAGEFHPTPPTRILDTRLGLGISEAVRTGGGRLADPNPINRRAETANHELKVTGVAGVPESGVSAVLLNVTAVTRPAPATWRSRRRRRTRAARWRSSTTRRRCRWASRRRRT